MKKAIALLLCATLLLASVVVLTSATAIDPDDGLLNPAASFLAKGARLGHPSSYSGVIGFNKWNCDTYGAGDTIYVTRTEGKTTIGEALSYSADDNDSDLTWFRVMVVEYDDAKDSGCYKVAALLTPASGSGTTKLNTVIPEGGFCVVVHNLETFEACDTREDIDIATMSAANVASFDAYAVGDKVDIIGVPSPLLPEFGLYETATAPVLDGVISAGEYGDPVMNINTDNLLCDYYNFKADDEYCTGKFYATYDSQNLYLAWDISSEHYKYMTAATADSSMWQFDCIQLNIGALSTYDDHMLNAITQGWSALSTGYDCMVQLGISVQEDGTTRICQNGSWFGNNSCDMTGFTKRSDSDAKTVYEVCIKLADLNEAFANYDLTFEKGTEFALSFSINTDDGTQRVLRLRDGGSIFGRNDYSKAPNAVLLGSKSAPGGDESKEEGNPNTGDSTIVFVLIGVLSLAAGAVVLKKVR